MNEQKYNTMAELIEDVLNEDYEARSNDITLYADVLQRLNAPSRVVDGIRALNRRNYPSLESITRIKRKLAEEKPEYRGTKENEERRFTLFKWYREFMKK